MTPDARVASAIDILDNILAGSAAEATLTTWARRNRFAGSKDRAAIRDLVFDALRCKLSFGWLGGEVTGRGLMLGRLRALGEAPDTVFTGQGYGPPALEPNELAERSLKDAPDPVRLDCPDWLWPELHQSLGASTQGVLSAMQSRAPVFLRVNASKATPNEALAQLAKDGIAAQPHPLSTTALVVTENPRRVQTSQAFASGVVELQDAASQAVAEAVSQAAPGGTVLDFCAGGGGKALALAALGHDVTAHDVDPNRMKDIPARAARAGVEIPLSLKPKGTFDIVLCDAPCSGSGAWRRQPAAKWELTDDRLSELTQIQDGILAKAKAFVAEGGVLAYATCSLLDRENAERCESFIEQNAEWTELFRKKLTPLDGGDGFFIAGLTRRNSFRVC